MRIDCHTHIFNTKFLPLAGIIKAVGNGWLPKPFCNLVQWYYLKKTDANALRYPFVPEAPQSYFEAVDEILEMDDTTAHGFLLSTDEEYIDFILRHTGDKSLGSLGISNEMLAEHGFNDSQRVDEIIKKQQAAAFVALPPWLVKMILKYILKKIYQELIGKYLDWFNMMTLPYERIATKFRSLFPDIDLHIHLDMDMDNWYELKSPTYNYDLEQVPRISKLTKEKNGRMIPFYAYDPNKTLNNLKLGIQEKGYLGVKFYPPSGYMPWNNETLGNERFALEDRKAWDKRNEELYDHCVQNHLPIFAHCNHHGMEAYKNAGVNSHPDHWRDALNAKPEYRQLILCLAHAGGDEGWFEETNNEGNAKFMNSLPGKVYELCTQYENVYCDFGYMPEIMKGDNLAKLRNRLLYQFERSAGLPYPFENKVIYGSDWHMLMQDSEYASYFEEFELIFPKGSAYQQKFFYQNAKRYLNLPAYLERFRANGFLTNEGVNYLEFLIRS